MFRVHCSHREVEEVEDADHDVAAGVADAVAGPGVDVSEAEDGYVHSTPVDGRAKFALLLYRRLTDRGRATAEGNS